MDTGYEAGLDTTTAQHTLGEGADVDDGAGWVDAGGRGADTRGFGDHHRGQAMTEKARTQFTAIIETVFDESPGKVQLNTGHFLRLGKYDLKAIEHQLDFRLPEDKEIAFLQKMRVPIRFWWSLVEQDQTVRPFIRPRHEWKETGK